MAGFDRHEATARARLERLVDRAEESVARARSQSPGPVDVGVSEQELDDGMQVRSDDDVLPVEAEEWVAVRDDDLVDTLAEAFNARDLDGVVELTTEGCATLGLDGGEAMVDPALGDLWNRRPSILMTRAVDDDRAVGILWERAAADTWSPVGSLHVDAVDDVAQVLEFSDDVGLIERLGPVPPTADDTFWPDADGLDDAPS